MLKMRTIAVTDWLYRSRLSLPELVCGVSLVASALGCSASMRGSVLPGQTPSAIAETDGIRFREDHHRRIQEAREWEREEQYDQAIAAYESVLESPIVPPLVYHRLGVLYDLTRRPQDAMRMYQRALAADPENVDILCDIGFGRELGDDEETARRYYESALRIEPTHERANNHLAILLVAEGLHDQAFEHFSAAGLSKEQILDNFAVAERRRLDPTEIHEVSETTVPTIARRPE